MDTAISLKKNLLEDFICPVCTNYMFPPMPHCVNGHSYCNDCYSRSPNCLQCLGHKTKFRKYTVEKIGPLLYFPCKYNPEGCLISAKGPLIADHVRYCDYSKKNCPFMESDNCCWRGRKKDFLDHAQEYHGTSVFFEDKKVMVVQGVGHSCKRSSYNCMFVVFGQVFRFTWEINDETGLMRFAAYNIKRPVDEYSYKITFLKGKKGSEAISSTGPCIYCDVDLGMFVRGFYLMTKYDMLKDICDTNGDLHYVVEICNKDAQVCV